jgi:preprotein translocase subunit SecY
MPGNSTRSYLSQTLKRIARINAFFLIYNIIGLQIIESILNINVSNLRGLGFTSQLILVNVLIDTIKRIRSFLNEEENSI